MNHRILRAFVVGLFVALTLGLWPALAGAQPLADRVPGDALFYVGWRGVEDMGPGYDQSHLKAVLEASAMGKFMSEYVPAALASRGRDNPDDAARLEMLGTLLPTMYKRGGAIFLAQPILAADEITPRIGMLVEAGADAEALEAKIAAVIAANKAKAPGGKNLARVVRVGSLVAALFGYSEKEAGIAGAGVAGAEGKPVSALSDEATFKAALKQVYDKPLVAFYLNFEEVLKLVDKSIAVRGEAGVTAQQWRVAAEALGMTSVKRVIHTGAFEGKSWGVKTYIESPTPRLGLATLLDCGPVTDDFLAMIPAMPEVLVAGRFDSSKLFAESRIAAAKVLASMTPPSKAPGAKPEDAQNQALAKVDNALVQIGVMTGVDLKSELFDALGDQWAVYSDRTIAGGGDLSRVIINKPRDPVKLEKALSTIGQVVPGFLAMQMPDTARNVQVRQIKVGNDVVHYVDASPVTPAWCIREGVLYIALYPQVIVDAIAVASAKGPSVLTNKDYLALRKQLGVEKPTGVAFADLPRTVDPSYAPLMLVSRLLLADGLKRGVVGPPMLLPPLSVLRNELVPAGLVSWADSAGWHMSGVMPFPGAGIFASQTSGLLGLGAMAAKKGAGATVGGAVPSAQPEGETWDTQPAPKAK